MHRRVAIALVVLLLPWPAVTQAAPPTARVEDQLIAALNQWRLDEGQLWPLQPNAQLTALAAEQARYLLSLPEIPDDIHAGPAGSTPQDRARAAGWPTYGRPEQIAIGEIGEIGPNVQTAIGYWQASAIHHRTVMNPAYREVGVAVLPHRFGYLFVVVLGARPNVLPAQVDPTSQQLYLSDERFSGAARSGEWLYRASEVRLFDAQGQRLTGWQAWQPTLSLPATAEGLLVVVYRTASQQTLDVIDLKMDRVLLPGETSAQAADAAAGPPMVASSTPIASASPAAQPPPGPRPTFRPVTATATTGAVPAVLLVYDARNLTVINVAGRPLDLTSLVIASTTQSLPLTRWQTPWLSGSLTAVAPGDCLGVWAWNEAAELPVPGACRFRRGVINVAPDERFWAEGDFTVQQGGVVLITCQARAGTCAIALPR